MNRFLDYLYSKSKLKQYHEEKIAEQHSALIRRGTMVNQLLLQINELKKERYALQMFIEENVADELKEKIFKK